MKKLVFSLILLPTLAFAQTPTEFNLKLKAADVDKLGKGLMKLPYEDVAELIQNLRQQVIEQQTPKPMPVVPPDGKKK